MDAMKLKEWTQVGATRQRLYLGGAVAIVLKMRGIAMAYVVDGNGIEFIDRFASEEAAIEHLDKKCDPTPTEYKFKTVTVYELNGRENVAYFNSTTKEWTCLNTVRGISGNRAWAEEQAREWLKAQPAS